jgi:hypothetical protein
LALVALLSRHASADTVKVLDEIYGSQKAADLVAQARQHDPAFSRSQVDREKAVALYAAAMEAQPNDPMNAALAERIAQLYTFYSDPTTRVKPDPARAGAWWNRSITSSSPKLLIWSQAHMGLASAQVMSRDYAGALDQLKIILEARSEAVELPSWRMYGTAKDKDGATHEQRELKRHQEALANLQRMSVDRVLLLGNKIEPDRGLRELRQLADRHRGTPVGDYAQKSLAVALGSSDAAPPSMAKVPDWTEQPVSEQGLPLATPATIGNPAAADSAARTLSWAWGGAAVFAASIVVLGWLRLKRQAARLPVPGSVD